MKQMREQGAYWPAGSRNVTNVTLSLSVLLNNMERQLVRCSCHLVSLAPEASRTQSKVCTQHEGCSAKVGDTREDPEKPSGLGSAASLGLCCSQARAGGACPPHGPPPPDTYAQAVRAHLLFSSPSSKCSGSWHGYAERWDGNLPGVGFIRTSGRRQRGGGRSSRSSPGRADGGPVQTSGTECGTGGGLEARVAQTPGHSQHLGSRGRLKGGTRRDSSHGQAASGPESGDTGSNTGTTFLFQLHDDRAASNFAEVLVSFALSSIL